jgi:histidyl-tRNA synthetase
MDAECVECCLSLCQSLGFQYRDIRTHISDRDWIGSVLVGTGVPTDDIGRAFELLDRQKKMKPEEFQRQASEMGMNLSELNLIAEDTIDFFVSGAFGATSHITNPPTEIDFAGLQHLQAAMKDMDLVKWGKLDLSIVRGLAYYTGTVFEVLADGERAVAGGGRYDKLIELMGGPPTPAVGFAMGDVVVSLLLEDKGLMPQGAELMEAVSRRPASVRPEVFVVGADDEQSDALVRRLSADLRRGIEADAYQQAAERKPWSAGRYDAGSGGVRPLHARASYKSTRNLKKLLADGEKQFARLAAIVHGPDRVQLKDFDARRDLTPKDVGLSDTRAEFSVDTDSPVYVGRAAERLLRI